MTRGGLAERSWRLCAISGPGTQSAARFYRDARYLWGSESRWWLYRPTWRAAPRQASGRRLSCISWFSSVKPRSNFRIPVRTRCD